ncbi:MAG: PAS domain S-box protein, partial [Candidatus Cloacimonetes bacterium]|nr:PAS domain S-box protein [Candidatus Cloacimonadota bacterium]
VLSDITERKQTEEALKESEKEYRTLVESIEEGIVNVDINETFTYANQAAVDIFGYSKDEMIGKNLKELTSPEMFQQLIKETSLREKGESNRYELVIKRENGEQRIIAVTSTPRVTENGVFQGSFGIFHDITERKQAEEILNQELRKRKILQDVALSLLETDLKKSIKTSLNAIRIGLDLPKAMLRIRVDPNNDWQIVDYGENLLGNESVLPTNIRGVDTILAYEKKEISVVNDVRKKYWYEKHKDIWEKTKTLAYLSIPCIDYAGDVKGILYLHDDKVRVWSDDDKNIGRAVAAELASIIERKQAEEELKISRERLKIANSVLRHDIANDIVVIDSALNIYRDEGDETMLDEIKKRVEKSLSTIQRQRDQERFIDSHAALDEYDMEKVANGVINNYPDIEINVTGTGKAYADNAVYSVFENIISNAIKHGKTTKMDIDISSDEEFCIIKFVDYGIGIPNKIKDEIFDEGFQYGETGHTGIGLYIVQKTIDEYDGFVTVEDNKPNGAAFVIRLRKIIER